MSWKGFIKESVSYISPRGFWGWAKFLWQLPGAWLKFVWLEIKGD